MDADLTAVKAALAEISDTELAALIAATYGVPQSAPGLLAWIWAIAERPITGSDLDRPKLAECESSLVRSERRVVCAQRTTGYQIRSYCTPVAVAARANGSQALASAVHQKVRPPWGPRGVSASPVIWETRMKKLRAMIATLMAINAGSVVAAEIGPEELASLVKGRKWQVGIGGNLSDPLIQAYWDFNSNGSMCVRFPGGKPDDRCADEGEWKLDGPTVCWELKRIGEQYGYKSACVRVERLNAQDFQMHNVKGFRQFAFRVAK